MIDVRMKKETKDPIHPSFMKEWVAKKYGFFLGAITAGVSAIRHSRTFHPRGRTYTGSSVVLATTAFEQEIAKRLEGKILVRLSTALWKNEGEWPDVLGIAIRFRPRSSLGESAFTEEAKPQDQDLLFATVEHPSLLATAPFTTNPHDFFKNEYFAVSPFSLEQEETQFFFRLSPERESGEKGLSRAAELKKRVEKKTAHFILSVRPKESSTETQEWKPVLKIELEEAADLNQEKLRFFPFRSGRGVYPRGWIQYMRIGAYRGSQATRPSH